MSPASRFAPQHPLVDTVHPGLVVTESRAPIVFLTADRINLLTETSTAGVGVVLATDEQSVLTPAFADVWRGAGAGWLVRSPGGGMRNGFSGRRIEGPAEALETTRIASADEVSVEFLHSAPSDSVEFIVNVSLRHRARSTTLLGAVAEELAVLATRGPPTSWGALEPTGNPWDRQQLTAFARERMPAETYLVANGPGYTASITARRTREGVEEITQVRFTAGVPSTLEFEAQREAVVSFLGSLATTSMPLVGLVLARPGRADLMVAPVLQHPPTPLALLVGPPGVKALRMDPVALTRDFATMTVGRPRIPGLLFPLGTLGEPTWKRLDDILATVGRERLRDVLGSQATMLSTAAEGAVDGQP